ncbi:hypothetical protein GQ53DRAFT_590306, partial [Thozetella sp. PMI_491]
FPGFTSVSEKIHILEPALDNASRGTENSIESPETIVLCTWGGGKVKHINKYIDGYRALFPASRLILVESSMFETMFCTVEKHTQSMLPLLDGLFPPRCGKEGCYSKRTLIHVMSNSGGVSFVSSIIAYQNRQAQGNQQPFPHTLLICDSTPGALTISEVVTRASMALAISTPQWVPVPTTVMHGLWAFVLFVTFSVSGLVLGGREIGWKYEDGIHNPKFTSPTETTRLYLYSKADKLVLWEDIEKSIAVAKEMAYNCLVERFEKSAHVSHASEDPERYWGAISNAWETAV